jgi:hypothetical protein
MSALKPSDIQLVPQQAAHGRLGNNVLGRDGATNTGEGVHCDEQITSSNSDLLILEDTTRAKTVLLVIGKGLIERKTTVCHV